MNASIDTHVRPSLAGIVAASLIAMPALTAAATAVPRATRASTTTIATRQTSKLGPVLVDSRGRLLYLSTHDAKNRSNCSGACAKTWTPILAGGRLVAKSGSGVNQRMIGRLRRSEGRLQVTYNNHPLYLYSKDKRAGDMHGEGANEFSGRWYVLNTRGNPVKPKSSGGPVCNPICGGY